MDRDRPNNQKYTRTGYGDTVKEEGARILPLRRGININIGLVIFLFVFLYLAYSLISFASRDNYSVFQVGLPGSLSEEQTYQALLLRNEQVVRADYSGYVDLYVQEGGRVSVGTDIASVDEVGSYSEQIREAITERALSKEDLLRMKTALKEIAGSYDGMNFGAVYERKNMLHSAVLAGSVSELYGTVISSTSAAEFFHTNTCAMSGTVVYYCDGFETKDIKELTAADFDTGKYERQTTQDLVAQGDFLYKIVPSENWKMAVPISSEEAAEYAGTPALNVTFLKNGLKTTAASSVVTGADGNYYLQLELSRYMVRFIADRYAQIRISRTQDYGFKIPKTSLTAEEYYMIPKEYRTDAGFIRVSYANGVESVSAADLEVVFSDDRYCYVSTESVESGAILARPDSDERCTVRLTAALTGVYKINKGYTEFCPVVILDSSDDYVLAAKNVENGITSYDTILLNAEGYRSGQILQ